MGKVKAEEGLRGEKRKEAEWVVSLKETPGRRTKQQLAWDYSLETPQRPCSRVKLGQNICSRIHTHMYKCSREFMHMQTQLHRPKHNLCSETLCFLVLE